MNRLPPVLAIMHRLGLEPDDWQLQVLEGQHRRLLLNCSRQAGKSTVVAVLSLLTALTVPGAVILLLARSQRQSAELFRIVADACARLNAPGLKRRIAHELEFATGSRIVSLPCNADTIRGFSGVHMLVIDEAARVPDDLYRTVRPMLAATDGRLLCLSTPNGRHGFFWEAWAKGGADWTRLEVPAPRISRITPEFLAEERRCLGESWYRQEYECSFEALEGLVYPDFARQVSVAGEPGVSAPGSNAGRRVGGLDFGFRNPFAAVWGVLDRDGVLWLTGEHYARQQPLSWHAQQLPRAVTWYADPAGANDIAELRCAGFTVRKGLNALRTGIMAVTARLQQGTLQVLPGACPHLLHEAGLYRWSSTAGDAETPVDEHNHALAALRYLVSRLDERQLGRRTQAQRPATEPKPPRPVGRRESLWHREELWRRLG